MTKRYVADVTQFHLASGESEAIKRVAFDAQKLIPYLEGMFNNIAPKKSEDYFIFRVKDLTTDKIVEKSFTRAS